LSALINATSDCVNLLRDSVILIELPFLAEEGRDFREKPNP